MGSDRNLQKGILYESIDGCNNKHYSLIYSFNDIGTVALIGFPCFKSVSGIINKTLKLIIIRYYYMCAGHDKQHGFCYLNLRILLRYR